MTYKYTLLTKLLKCLYKTSNLMWKKKKILRRKTLENVIIFLVFMFNQKNSKKNTAIKIAIIVNIVYK